MYDYADEPEGERGKVAKQIAKTAELQHLTGQRRDVFTDSVSLCSSCKWSSSRRREHQNTRQMNCSIFNGPCPEDIKECSEYGGINSLTLNQMAEIATIIDIGPRRRVGFQDEK